MAISKEKRAPPLVLQPGIFPLRRSKREEIERQRQDYIKFRTAEEDKWNQEAQRRIESLSLQHTMDPVMKAKTEAHELQLVEKFKKEKEAEESRRKQEKEMAKQQMEKDAHDKREEERFKREKERLDDIWRHMD